MNHPIPPEAPRDTALELVQSKPSVLDQVRDLIVSGHFESGKHLQEVEVAAQLGVSRTPVREAFISLKHERLLIHQFNRGYFVRRFTLKEVIDAYEVRANLEGMACRLAAEKGLKNSKVQSRLMQELEEGDRLLSLGRLTPEAHQPFSQMNQRFHDLILSAAGNQTLVELIERAMSLPLASSRIVHWRDYQGLLRSHEVHHAIFKAVAEGRGARAEALMNEHILGSGEQIGATYPWLEK